MINMPVNQPLVDTRRTAIPDWIAWFSQVTAICFAVQSSGTTANRPVKTNVWIGRTYFDTTLGKPIWAKTIASTSPYTVTWVDATGTTV